MGIFENLFVFELANNHFGDVDHGINIIRNLKKVCADLPYKKAVKFQYRNLDTFIHPSYKESDLKYIKRFSETRLSGEQFCILKKEAEDNGFITMCTPFDEDSVDLIVEHDFDIIKIASCAFTDWPLLEKIADTNKPIIASAAASTTEDIDKVVSFFLHRNKEFCLMHCVGEYPTARDNLQLNQIDFLKNRYAGVTIGYSTHESPDNFDSIRIAIAKGAKVFERHVGIDNERYPLNAYSSSPEQVRNWLLAAQDAMQMCGIIGKRHEFSDKERTDLRGLKRGVFAKENIKKGEKLVSDKLFYAIPNIEGQLLANDMSKYMEYTATEDIDRNAPILFNKISKKNCREEVVLIVKELRRLIIKSGLALPNRIELELSHHYGLNKYKEWGAAILNCINREYCKKMIIILPKQNHPIHYHIKKEETFYVLYGDVTINLDGESKRLVAGDMITVERGVKHSFSSEGGCILEELSTTHYIDDSYYDDKNVALNKNRKTKMTYWSDWLHKEIL